MMRRHLMPSKHWQRLTQETKDGLREGLLGVIGNESDGSVRTALAMLIGLIARHEPWPQLLQYIHTLATSTELTQRQLSVYLLSVISSETVASMLPHLLTLLPVLDAALQDAALPPASIGHAIVAVARLSELIGSEHIEVFQSVVRKVVTVSQRLLPQDEQPVWEAIELLEVLVESEVPVLANDLPATVEFCIKLSVNTELGDGLRIKAITFLGLVTRYKKKYIVKHKLNASIVLALFSVLCEEAKDDNPLGILMADSPHNAASSSNDDEVLQTAAQALDTCARHLSPDKLLQPLMPAVKAALMSQDQNKVKGGYLALAMITDGCSERLRTKHLDVLLQCVCRGVTSDTQVVRDSALLALAQFADYLQPDISTYHQQLLPIIFTYLSQICTASKNGSPDPPGSSRLFYAVEVFCENMEQEDLLPHLQPLLQHVLAILQVEQTSQYMKKNAISVIGAVALSVKQHMAPYFEQVVALLKTHLLVESEDGDSTPLQLQSLETLSQMTRSLGGKHIEKYAGDITQLALSLLEKAVKKEDPELRKTCYRLFAALASVMRERLAPELPVVIDSMLASLKSTEGVVPLLKDDSNKAILQSLGELEFSDSEGEEGNEDNEEDLDVAGYSVENMFLEEKEDTCVALRELAESCGEGFIPYICRVCGDVYKLVNYPNEDVRQAALVTVTQFVVALAKSPTQQAQESFDHWVRVVVAKISELVRTDEYSVVTAGLEGYADLLTGAGGRILHYEGHLEAILACITDVINKKTKCQSGDTSDDGEDDDASLDEAEMDEMLVEYAGDVVVPLGKALGPQAFSQYFPRILELLGRRLRPNSSECVRSYVIGNLAECVDVLGSECPPFVINLLPLFVGAATDPSSGEVRSNAIFGLGLLGLHGGEAIIPELPGILIGLSELMTLEKEPRATDNICAALARIIGAQAKYLPVPTILPALLNMLPLREDFEENMTIFNTFSVLYQQREPTLLQNMHIVLRTAAFVYSTHQSDGQCQAAIEDLVRRVKADTPEQLATLLQNIEPEFRERLERAGNSTPPPPPPVAAAAAAAVAPVAQTTAAETVEPTATAAS
uniref:Importin-4-like n=1 Tax=Hirondellea gigas TaxID=1518452 RepID=A0A6A7G1S5_9CRUS